MGFGCAFELSVWFKFDSLGLLLFESCAHSALESTPFVFILFTLSDELDVVFDEEVDEDDEVNKAPLTSKVAFACPS